MKIHNRLVMGTTASLAAVAASLATSAPATAQTTQAPPAADSGLAEIVVTARKVSENLQDVPVAVTVHTGEDLIAQGARTVVDIARFTPGLFMREGSSTSAAATIALRGQVQTDVLITLDPSVGTYVDDVYWARAYGLNADLLDVANVQVLKGPQGTLFGRNTTGGAILFSTNKPDLSEFHAKVALTYGSYAQRTGEVMLNVPVVTDKLGVRFAGKINRRNGWWVDKGYAAAPTNTAGRRYGENNDEAYRLKVLLQPTDTLSLLVTGDYWHTNANSTAKTLGSYTPAVFSLPAMAPDVAALVPGAVAGGCTTCVANYFGTYPSVFAAAVAGGDPTAVLASDPSLTTAYNKQILTLGTQRLGGLLTARAADPSFVANDGPNNTSARTRTLSGIGTLETGFGQVKGVVAWREIKNDTIYDLDGTPFAIHTTNNVQKVSQFSAELQATGKAFNDLVKFAGGVFYFEEKGFDGSQSPRGPLSYVNSAGVRTNFAAATTSVSWTYGYIRNSSKGAYLQFDVNPIDRLTLTAGARYSEDRKQLTIRSGNVDLIKAGYVLTDSTGIAISQRYIDLNPDNFGDLANFYTSTANGPSCSFPAQGCALVTNGKFAGWSYTLGASYEVTDDIMVYAKHAKGFRSGGMNLRATTLANAVPFKPEIAYSTEIGFKSQLWDNRIRLNVAAYHTLVNDIQRSTLFLVNGVPVTFLSNAAKARINGVEAELTVAPIEGLTLSASGALVDPKYLSFSEAPSRTNLTGDRSMESFDSVPKQQFALQGSYEFAVNQDSKLTLAANYSWQGRTKVVNGMFFVGSPALVVIDPQSGETLAANFIDSGTTPPTGLLGASVTYTFQDRYKLTGWVRNLTDNRSINNATNASLGYVNATIREPRTFGVTATVNF